MFRPINPTSQSQEFCNIRMNKDKLGETAVVVPNIVSHFKRSSHPCYSYCINQTCCASADSVFLLHRQSESVSFSAVHSSPFHCLMTYFVILNMRCFLGSMNIIRASYVDEGHSNKHDMNRNRTMNIVT
jgi:hypothetical protein